MEEVRKRQKSVKVKDQEDNSEVDKSKVDKSVSVKYQNICKSWNG